MLKLKGITKKYGEVPVLKGINMEIKRGEIVGIVGLNGAGKSTLMNTVLKKHIAIVSDVAGTTRNAIQGVYNDKDTQIIFVDTPGIHKPQDKLGKYLNKQTY